MRTEAEYQEFARNAVEMEPFMRQLFPVFVDQPLQTPEQAKLAASRIACAVCDAGCMAAHLAYGKVRDERRASGLPLGS